MGARGPAPVPTEILKMRGSWRGNSNKHEPRPQRGAPKMPSKFPKACAAVWKTLTRTLDDMGLLTKADGHQLERYCRFFVRWRQCEDFIFENGMSYSLKSDDPTYYMARLPGGTAVIGFAEYPQVKESHRLDKALKQIESSFGLTPSARARLTVGDEGEVRDEFEELLSGKSAVSG